LFEREVGGHLPVARRDGSAPLPVTPFAASAVPAQKRQRTIVRTVRDPSSLSRAASRKSKLLSHRGSGEASGPWRCCRPPARKVCRLQPSGLIPAVFARPGCQVGSLLFRIALCPRATACDPEEVQHPLRSRMLSGLFPSVSRAFDTPLGWSLLPGAPALTRTGLAPARTTRLSGRTKTQMICVKCLSIRHFSAFSKPREKCHKG